jgi:hypothetical protein
LFSDTFEIEYSGVYSSNHFADSSFENPLILNLLKNGPFMKTLTLGSIALLFLSLSFFSCAKPEEELKASSSFELDEQVLPLADNQLLLQSQCPDCVSNFDATSSTPASYAVFTLNNSTGVLTSTNAPITTIASTSQLYNVGNVIVTVSHDATNVYFTFERNNSTGGFESIRFHSPAQVINTNGGQFAFSSVKKFQIIKPRASLAACDEVTFTFRVRGGGNATVAGEVTSSSLSYILRDLCAPVCTIEIGDYRTQTRGYWRNNNGQAYLNAHNIFPLTIGCDEESLQFSDKAAVKNYLESGDANGTPGSLPNGGTLGAQVLTLLINIEADKADADFGAASSLLNNLKIDIDEDDILAHPEWAVLSEWNGKTVTEILAIAQKVLGGCPEHHTPSEVNAIVTAINENFDNGTVDNGLLTCGD